MRPSPIQVHGHLDKGEGAIICDYREAPRLPSLSLYFVLFQNGGTIGGHRPSSTPRATCRSVA
jgi:hypothetical protein